MLQSRDRSAAILAALVGGLVGMVALWLSRPDPPSCTILDSGMRACMPILVEGPPVWLYLAFAVVGALLGVALALAFARRGRVARQRSGTSVKSP